MRTFTVTAVVEATGDKPLDAAQVGQWFGESLSNPDTMDTRWTVKVHNINVELGETP